MKSTCSISFKLTAFNNDTHKCLHVNFLSNWIGFTVAIKKFFWLNNAIVMSYGLVKP